MKRQPFKQFTSFYHQQTALKHHSLAIFNSELKKGKLEHLFASCSNLDHNVKFKYNLISRKKNNTEKRLQLNRGSTKHVSLSLSLAPGG